MSSAPKARSSWLGVVMLVLGLMAACGLCIIPSLPNFFADQQHHKQRECREGLTAVMDRFLAQRDGGVPVLSELKSAVPGDRSLPYTFVLGEGVTVPPPAKQAPSSDELARQLSKVRTLVEPGLRGTCPDCELTIACVGNTDGDDELDLLSVSSQVRYAFGHSRVDALETYVQSKDFPFDGEHALRFEATDGGD